MPNADAPMTDYDKTHETAHPYTRRPALPAGTQLYPGLVYLGSEAALSTPTATTFANLVAGNYLDVQYKGEDGTVQYMRCVYHNQSADALYVYDSPRTSVVQLVKSKIVGMSTIN